MNFKMQSYFSPQDLERCDPKGTDCIEKNFAETFVCNTTCVGIYADVQWMGKDIEEEREEKVDATKQTDMKGKIHDDVLDKLLLLEEEMKLLKREIKNDFTKAIKSATGQEGEELDRKKYKKLISEYRKFKTTNVKHFRFNSAGNLSRFGEFLFVQQPEMGIISLGEELPPSTLQLVEIYFDTATFDDIERDKKIKTEAQLSLIGGTMGLLTGFSIISGVEIIFFLFRYTSWVAPLGLLSLISP